MKTKLTLLLFVLLPLAARAADDLSTALQKGLFEEEANQNLPAAIKAYESLLATSDEQRKLAATALFRLGECYRKLGNTNDAVTQYQRLLRDYADQDTLAILSRQNLRGLGADRMMPATMGEQGAATGLTSEGRARLKELLQNEIKIAERFAAEQRKRIDAGTLPVGEAVRYERDVLGLKRQLVAVDGLSSEVDRNEWRNLLMQEIKLAEDAVRVEQQKLEVGRSVASEVARLQRDVLILKRELVTFESAPRTVTQSQAAPVSSIESEELARTERILAQLSGWDLAQVRRLLPTLVPDADFESYDRQLTEAQEKMRTSTGEEQEKWVRNADVNKAGLQQRRDEVKRILQERIARLRAQVNEQLAEAKRTQRTGGSESDALTPAQTAALPIQSESARSEALLKQLQALSRSELVNVLPTVVSDPLLNSLLEQLSQAARKHVELETKFGSGHPDVKANRTALEVLERQVYDRTEGIMKGLAIKAAAVKQSVGRDSVEP